MTFLDECYASYVNLDSRQDRHEHMMFELHAADIEAERTRGRLPSEYGGDPARVATILGQTPGALGCWMCQVQVMQEAHKRGKHAFVMEDDLQFCLDFHTRLGMIARFLSEREWDVMWLGGTYHAGEAVWHPELGVDAEPTDDPHFVRTYGAFSTHAYIVRYDSIPGILTALDAALPHSVGIDTSFIKMQPYLYTYAFVPGCVKQRDDRSDIGDGYTIFSNFAKLGPHWFADRMEDYKP